MKIVLQRKVYGFHSVLFQSDQGLWSLYVLNLNNNESRIARELVELLHVEDRLAYVSGTYRPVKKLLSVAHQSNRR